MNRHVFIAMMAISWFGLGFITADRWFGKYTIQAPSPVYVFDRDQMLNAYGNGIWVEIECGSVRNPCPTPGTGRENYRPGSAENVNRDLHSSLPLWLGYLLALGCGAGIGCIVFGALVASRHPSHDVFTCGNSTIKGNNWEAK